jgi:hypothetical protein
LDQRDIGFYMPADHPAAAEAIRLLLWPANESAARLAAAERTLDHLPVVPLTLRILDSRSSGSASRSGPACPPLQHIERRLDWLGALQPRLPKQPTGVYVCVLARTEILEIASHPFVHSCQ